MWHDRCMIEVSQLSKRYGDKLVVDDLTFTVRPGVVTGFLGPNGAGKSTTMRMIVGLDNPTKGRATIDGKAYSEYSNPVFKIGTLLDAGWADPHRSAYDHLRWLAASNGIGRRRVDEVLSLVGLTEVAERPMGKFSLGMGQRLGLAGALLGDPEVLVLDEPMNGLDPEGIRWVRDFVRYLAGEGRTVMVSSHMLSEMALTADHLVVIGQGKLIADASTGDFIRNAQATATVVRSAHLDQLAKALKKEKFSFERSTDVEGRPRIIVKDKEPDAVGAMAFSYGIGLWELSPMHASLEDAFVAMTRRAVEFHSSNLSAAPRSRTLYGEENSK